MSNYVEFMEFVSKNDDVRKELEALSPELEGKDEQGRIDILVKFAAKYGLLISRDDNLEFRRMSWRLLQADFVICPVFHAASLCGHTSLDYSMTELLDL